MSKYKVAIIGTGRMAGLMEDEQPYTNRYSKPYSHFASYAAIEETEVVAVANRSPERMKAFCDRWDFHNTYLDYKKMIEVEKPDIVSVTTPTFARAEPIIFAAEHGVKGIYAEKGLCSSLAEADRIQEACNSNGVAFNWGAARRQHSGYIQVAEAIAKGGIGKPTHAVVFTFTDLIKHHPHTLDTVSMMLGDPKPVWVEGRLVEKGDPLDATKSRMGPRFGPGLSQRLPLPNPEYDPEGHRFVPPEGQEIADPLVDFYRVGYENGAEGVYIPARSGWNIEVHGTEGFAASWDNGGINFVRRGDMFGDVVDLQTFRPTGESHTVNTIRDIIREIETGQRTKGNIDTTMQIVEAQFGIAHSHLQGGARVALPVSDRSLLIPGG